MNQNRKYRRTTVISVGLVAFLAGLYFVKLGVLSISLWIVVVLFCGIFVLKKRNFLKIVAVMLFGLSLGMWRGGLVKQKIDMYQDFIGNTVEVSGRIFDDPIYDDKGRMDFRIESVKINNKSLPGQIRIKARINGVRRGDIVRATGKINNGFGNYQAAMYYANVTITNRSKSIIENLRRQFFAAVYSVLPDAQAGLGLGFLVGLRTGLPKDLDEQLRIAGLTHIVVASGFNLTVLIRLSRRLLANFSKYQAFIGSIVLMLLFLAVTGASPSMIRASVVTFLSLLAWYYGRRFQPIMIILLGAVLTAGISPLFIWYDVGWWLSFLAFAGVLVIAPIITSVIYGKRTPPLIPQVAIETTSAQIMATPLILSLFGKFSLVALFANVAVVPFISIAMLFTLFAGLAGLFLAGGLAAWIAIPAKFILSYIISATSFFASPSWAQKDFQISGAAMVSAYGLVLLVVMIYLRYSKLVLQKLPSVVE